mmetsp:Transcript_24738/g.68889  ORF Transcript_24738/g.68889 Transcript_24738/m.68889 type:complete len:240 (-) Transcript_24738:218-937(-)
MHIGAVTKQTLADIDGRGFARVAGVFLERKAKHRDLLPRDGVEHAADDPLHKAVLLVVVDVHYLLPVIGDLLQANCLADPGQVEDVLLKARPPKPNGCIEKLRADARVLTNGKCHLLDVSPSGLAKRRNGVDGGDPLCQHGVGSEFCKLRAPQVGGENSGAGDPLLVHALENIHGLDSGRRFIASDQHSVRVHEVADCCPLSKELRIGQDLKRHIRVSAVAPQHLLTVPQCVLSGLCRG